MQPRKPLDVLLGFINWKSWLKKISKFGVLGAALTLSGCVSFVTIQSQGGVPKTSIWPFGVRVDIGTSHAITVNGNLAGIGTGCLTTVAGFAEFSCTIIDPKTCGVAIIHDPTPKQEAEWDAIARETKARCLPSKTLPKRSSK
jgi:hypothetical protein